MKTFRTFYQLFVFSILLSFVSTAFAQSEPYADWNFDLNKAVKSNDAKAISALVTAQPDLARIWFYGYVYDVVTTGVPADEQTSIRNTCSQIAQALSTLGEANQDAQKVMEQLADATIQTRIKTLRLEEERWENATGDVGMLPLQLSVVNAPSQATQIFYRALFKASKWKTKLGGLDRAARFRGIARRLASGFALGFGEFNYWKALATYEGADTVSLNRLDFVEETLGKALNRQVSTDAKQAYIDFKSTYATIAKTRQDSLLVGLVMNGLAASATVAGDHQRAVALREQLHGGIRPLQMRMLNEVVHGQLIRSYLKAGKLDQALRGVEQFTKAINPDRLELRSIRLLSEAATAFEAESIRAEQGSFLLRSIRYGEASIAILNTLSAPSHVAVSCLSAGVETLRVQTQSRIAVLYVRLGTVHKARADYQSAKTAFASAQTRYSDALGQTDRAMELELEMATCSIEQGLFDEAEVALDALRRSTLANLTTIAASHALSAQQFLLRGAYAPAFAHANEGLKLLHEGKVDEKSLYGSLHSWAALVLESAGFRDEALARWEWVDQFSPSFESSAHQSRILGAMGRVDEAVEKLEPYFETDAARETTVLQGCLLASTERRGEARASLTVLVPQLSLPSTRRFRAAGYACLAQIEAKSGHHSSALKHITAARRALEVFPSAALRWKIDLLEARSLLGLGKRAKALPAYVQALNNLELNQYDSKASGFGVFEFFGGPIISVDAVHEEAADLAITLAKQAPKSKRQSLLKEAVQRIRMHRALEMSTGSNTYQQVYADLADIARLRTLRTQMLYLSERLEKMSLSQRRQAELTRAFHHSASQVDALVAERIKAAKSLAHPYESRLKNRPEARVSVYYIVRPTTSYAVLRGANGYRLYTLPGQKSLVGINEKLSALLRATPKAWSPSKRKVVTDPNFATWKRLRDHARTLVPFMFDGAAKTIAGKEVELFLDGCLVRTMFDALVIKSPPKRQRVGQTAGPTYFSTLVNPIYLIGENMSSETVEGQTALVFGSAPVKVCVSTSTQDCVSEQSAAVVRDLIENTPNEVKRPVSKIRESHATQAALVLGVPLNIADGSVGVEGGVLPLDRATGGLAELLIPLSHWDDDAAKNERGLIQMWGMLGRRGTQGVALHNGGVADAEASSAAVIAQAMTGGASTITRLRAWMNERARSSVDVKQGGLAYHHPYYWAQWQVLGEPANWIVPKQPEPTESASSAHKTDTEESVQAPPAVAPSDVKAPAVEDPFATTEAEAIPDAVSPVEPAKEAPEPDTE
jgi:tetratricopeptide (TPR) repeat protein